MTANVFQAGAGGIIKIHLSTRTILTYEDTCFLAEAKTKTVPTMRSEEDFDLSRSPCCPAACACLVLVVGRHM